MLKDFSMSASSADESAIPVVSILNPKIINKIRETIKVGVVVKDMYLM